MKQLTGTLFILMICLMTAKSQDYVPFPTENANWNVFCANDNQPHHDRNLIRYAIHGDTVINEISYKRLCVEQGDIFTPTIEGIGGIREEDKRIYYQGETLFLSTDEENLLYDFNVAIGDTIFHDAAGYYFSVILDIDSTEISGEYRKRYKTDYTLNCFHEYDYVIEGIGSVIAGLLSHISDIPTGRSSYYEHVCFKQDDEEIYLNPNFNLCYHFNFPYQNENIDPDDDIKIYPNPCRDYLIIETQENMLIIIFSIDGKLIGQHQLTAGINTIDLNLKSGIYFARMSDLENRIAQYQKIIKE